MFSAIRCDFDMDSEKLHPQTPCFRNPLLSGSSPSSTHVCIVNLMQTEKTVEITVNAQKTGGT